MSWESAVLGLLTGFVLGWLIGWITGLLTPEKSDRTPHKPWWW